MSEQSRLRAHTYLLFLALSALLAVPTFAKAPRARQAKEPQVIDGTIDHFDDGDTYWLKRKDGSKVKLREWVEDAPEIAHNSKEVDQPGGQEALKYCTNKWKGKHVTAIVKGKSYDRLVVQTTADGETRAIGLDLVSAGLAQVYPLSTPRPPQAYKDAEVAAQEKKLGVFKDGAPVAPWDWRKQQRDKPK